MSQYIVGRVEHDQGGTARWPILEVLVLGENDVTTMGPDAWARTKELALVIASLLTRETAIVRGETSG